MTPVSLIVTRDVTKKECPWLEDDVRAGSVVYVYEDYTYGCISPAGIAVTYEPDEGPFFEMPNDSLIPENVR